MGKLFLDSINAPQAVKQELYRLSKQTDFTKQATNCTNGYLFFGQNNLLNRTEAYKFYYWGGDPTYHAESQQLAQLNSEYVIDIYYAALINSEWAFFITPYCTNGDLDRIVSQGPIGIHSSIDYLVQILSGLSYLHSIRCVHRDLKPGNILIADDGRALIGDFGSVKKIPTDSDNVPGSGHSIPATARTRRKP